MVLSVRISLKISAAECPASANNEEEWNTTPATAFTRTNARFTSLSQQSSWKRVQSDSGYSYAWV